MKKFIKVIAAILAVTALVCFAGCKQKSDEKTITVGASVTPHAEILEAVRQLLKDQGYELKIVEFTDYVKPNLAVSDGELDANYFQHQPYLTDFNMNNKTNLVAAGSIHYEPYALYAGKTKTVADLKEGAQIAVSNDSTNEARALRLLESEGLIKLKEGVGLSATKIDIAENPLKLEIVEIEAAQLPRSLQDVDMAVINGNYAIDAGLSVNKDALVVEDKNSDSAITYANIIAVRAGDENLPKIKALVEALRSATAVKFIEETYDGAVIPSK